MEKAKVSSFQMFVLIVMFEMGSAILLGLGSQVKQDSWIAILFGLAGGIIVFFIYYRLYMYFPDLPLTSYLQKIVGKWLGRIIGFLYIIYFIYIASRVLRDFGELLTTTIYNSTPLFVINTLMIITIIYGLHKGFEVIARVGEIFFGVVYFAAILGMLLIVFSGLIHLGNLKPILENGWKPIIKTLLRETIVFPFGEMVVFTMLLPFLNEKSKAKIVCIGGMILAGINITITSIVNITVLGVSLYYRSTFPLLTTIGKIQIADFIERLDVLFMLYLIIGGFFKISIFYYAAVAGAADIFQIKNQRKLGFPIGLIVLFSSITIASNFAEFIKEGVDIVTLYLSWPFQIIIPSILLIIAFFRDRKKRTSSA
ncbi:spore gernimation protein KB [Bacillus sp. AFS073361]|uniref:GerAB/ArcD/ProY family transporter n=1 Tax=Bacillaceae TaxID=186817 RepID=UPI000BF85901|nr:GerAB/ArcD/ProY family transporter [Bacillus sp. AFS073361]PFP25815.1 spore gernimation protein KB [Bacillus sp. AFS073361]